MFFTAVYISSSLVLGAVFSIININILFISCLPPVYALSVPLLLASKALFNLDTVVVELGFILKAIYNYFLVS